MKLSELKKHLTSVRTINWKLENGTNVPAHCHITEIGKVTREFIDCGGVLRKIESINIQLWYSTDYEHRLSPKKFLDIISLSEEKLNLDDFVVEIEYQQETINKYHLEFTNETFILKSTLTECLAPDSCGVPTEKPKIKINDLTNQNSCDPNNGCC